MGVIARAIIRVKHRFDRHHHRIFTGAGGQVRQVDGHRSAHAAHRGKVGRSRHGQDDLPGERIAVAAASVLFIFSGKLAVRHGVNFDDRTILRVANIERGKEIFRNAKHHVEQIGSRQGHNGLSGGDNLVVTYRHVGGNAAERGGQRHLRQLFAGDFQRGVSGVAVGPLDIHFRL